MNDEERLMALSRQRAVASAQFVKNLADKRNLVERRRFKMDTLMVRRDALVARARACILANDREELKKIAGEFKTLDAEAEELKKSYGVE
jgi:hypothetical protein